MPTPHPKSDSHSGTYSSLHKHATSTWPIYVVQDSKPVRCCCSRGQNVLTIVVIFLHDFISLFHPSSFEVALITGGPDLADRHSPVHNFFNNC